MSELLESVPEVGGPSGTAMVLPPVESMQWEVWALAWPVILSFALDSILGLASMLMVGRLGAEAVGAVGLATQILGAVRAGIAAVGTGTVALVARYIGANDRETAEEVLKQSVILGVLVSTVIVGHRVRAPVMTLFNVGSDGRAGRSVPAGGDAVRAVRGIFRCAPRPCAARGYASALIGGIIDVLAIFLNYVLILASSECLRWA